MKTSAGILLKRTIASTLCASVLLAGYSQTVASEINESTKNDVTPEPQEGSTTYFKTDLIDFDRDEVNRQTVKLAYEQYKKLHNGDVYWLDNEKWSWKDWGATVEHHDCRQNVPAMLFVDWSTCSKGREDVRYPENSRYQMTSLFYDVNQSIPNWAKDNHDGENAYNSLDAARREWKANGEAVAYQNLVGNILGENNKPQFNLSVYDPFNKELSDDGRKVYAGIDTEFIYSDGYYVLDSDQYDYKYHDSSRQIKIADDNTHGFFPLSAKNEKENVNFSIQFQTDFTMSEDGKYNGKDCVFEFSGDDDVWVFVDDKLALDLGGIHEKCSGKIDFANQKVIYNCGLFKPYEGKPGNDGNYFAPGESVSFKELGLDCVLDNGKHTLRFFYLERGGGESNCKIKFNLPTINTNKDIKGDYTLTKKTPQGDFVDGAGFTLYDSKDQVVGGEQFTDENGKVTFRDLATGVYTLKETTVPEGYCGDGRNYTLLVSGNASDNLIFSLMEKDTDGNQSLVRNNTVYNSKSSELGVTLSKSAKLVNWQDRTYKINLAAEAKLSKKSVTENPVDIILVLDASGSMYFPSSLQPYQRDEGEMLDRNRSYYFVSNNVQATVYKTVWNGNNWIYYDSSNEYMSGSKNQGTISEKVTRVQNAYGQWNERYTYSCSISSNIQFYTSDNPSPRINELKASARNFIVSMAKISENNRIGLIYFNREAGQLLDGKLLKLTSDNVEKLLMEIEHLDGKISGGTRQDLGMQYALEMVNAALEEERAARNAADVMDADTDTVMTKKVAETVTEIPEDSKEDGINTETENTKTEQADAPGDSESSGRLFTTETSGAAVTETKETSEPVNSQEDSQISVETAEVTEKQVDREKSENNKDNQEPSRKRYVVLFTDGCPNGSHVETDLNGEEGYATRLKAIDGVKVISVGIDISDYMEIAERLLTNAASYDEDGNPLYFKGSASNMEDLFQRIGKLIIDENWEFEYYSGEVRDYINPKFKVIDAGGGSIGRDENGSYVSWNVDALEDWKATIYLQADEDYLGGNAVNTNGPESGVQVLGKWYYFEQPKVNVRLIVQAGSTEDTIFLGQSLARYFTRNQIDRIFPEQKKDASSVTISYQCTDAEGKKVYASDTEVPKTISNLGKYIGGLSPETDTTYYFKVIAAPNIADDTKEAEEAAKSMSSDGNFYTASMQRASESGKRSASATGTYHVKVVDGTLVIQKKYNRDFLSNLPYSANQKELIEAEQSTVFRVERYPENAAKESVTDGTAELLESFFVTVNGNDSQKIVGLKAGVYRVVEDTQWTWKYNLNKINETWVDRGTGETKNNFSSEGETGQAFKEMDGIFYLGKFRAGVVRVGESEKNGDREETFADVVLTFKNNIDTDIEHFPSWFGDTTHVKNVFRSGGEILDTHLPDQSADVPDMEE